MKKVISFNSSSLLFKRWGMYSLGLFLMSFGVAFSVISDLGVSPVSALPYSFSLITGLQLGTSTMIIYAFLILLQGFILGKDRKLALLLQIICSIMFGYFTDLSLFIIQVLPTDVHYGIQLTYLVISIFLVAIGLFLYLPANLITLPYDGMVNSISLKTKKEFSTVKIVCDVTIVTVSAALCLIFTKELGSVREGTLLTAIGVGKLLAILITLRKQRDGSLASV